jgi:hypothetical protein
MILNICPIGDELWQPLLIIFKKSFKKHGCRLLPKTQTVKTQLKNKNDSNLFEKNINHIRDQNLSACLYLC